MMTTLANSVIFLALAGFFVLAFWLGQKAYKKLKDSPQNWFNKWFNKWFKK